MNAETLETERGVPLVASSVFISSLVSLLVLCVSLPPPRLCVQPSSLPHGCHTITTTARIRQVRTKIAVMA